MGQIYRDRKGNEYRVCNRCDKPLPIQDYWLDHKLGKQKPRATCKVCEVEKKIRREPYEAVRVPAAPLAALVERTMRTMEISETDLAASLNITSRTFRAWRSGERKMVNLETADKIVTGLGLIWEDIFDDKTCERLRAC